MYIADVIHEKHNEFLDLCHDHHVSELYAFGSAITDRFDTAESDVDIVVEIGLDDPLDKGDALLSLWDKLEKFFGRRVDLLTSNSIHNPYLKSNIERTRKLIYDGNRKEIFI
jgi:predicted nucleotidyltransferase